MAHRDDPIRIEIRIDRRTARRALVVAAVLAVSVTAGVGLAVPTTFQDGQILKAADLRGVQGPGNEGREILCGRHSLRTHSQNDWRPRCAAQCRERSGEGEGSLRRRRRLLSNGPHVHHRRGGAQHGDWNSECRRYRVDDVRDDGCVASDHGLHQQLRGLHLIASELQWRRRERERLLFPLFYCSAGFVLRLKKSDAIRATTPPARLGKVFG